jgi:hypothetical protein
VSRGMDVSPALGGGVSRPTGLGSPPDLPLPGRRGSMQLGSPLGRPPEQQERPSPAAEAETTLNRTEVSNQQDGPLSSCVYSFEPCAVHALCLAQKKSMCWEVSHSCSSSLTPLRSHTMGTAHQRRQRKRLLLRRTPMTCTPPQRSFFSRRASRASCRVITGAPRPPPAS